MRRREFLAALPAPLLAQKNLPDPVSLSASAEILFLDIVRGYVANLVKTSQSFAVIEYPGATVTQSFLAKSGRSVSGVTRMLPALAAWIVSGRQPGVLALGGQKYDLLDVTGSAIVHGTDPSHPDYWQPAKADGQDQRQVEASLVAWTLWLLKDTLLPQLAPAERRRIDAWLASCTAVPVRRNNWAWFTAVNQAARLALNEQFPEFSYGQSAMFDDLKALDAMYAGEGWYNDAAPGQAFDYYNSWVFASHFLYWNAMVGAKFPDWSERFSQRLRPYLETAPMFFGASGAHVPYGRSLIYRWGVLTPLVLAQLQGKWPHDASLLHRLVRLNLEYHSGIGAVEKDTGKLRETYSEKGAAEVREPYIDGGHPYWGMQAFALWLIPRTDPFWDASRGQLPVEKASFHRNVGSAGLALVGEKNSGHVRLLQARSSRQELHYRDKYNKFTYSTHFPPILMQRQEICPWDSALVVRDRLQHTSFGRGAIAESRLLDDGMEIAYPLAIGDITLNVRTTLLTSGEFELRVHRVIAPAELPPNLELAEGSLALGLDTHGEADTASAETFSLVRNRRTGLLIGSWTGTGWAGLGAAGDLGKPGTEAGNLIHPVFVVNTLFAPLKPGAQVFTSVHYASPRPLAHPALHATARQLLAKAAGIGAGTTRLVKPEAAKPVSPPSTATGRKTSPATKLP